MICKGSKEGSNVGGPIRKRIGCNGGRLVCDGWEKFGVPPLGAPPLIATKDDIISFGWVRLPHYCCYYSSGWELRNPPLPLVPVAQSRKTPLIDLMLCILNKRFAAYIYCSCDVSSLYVSSARYSGTRSRVYLSIEYLHPA